MSEQVISKEKHFKEYIKSISPIHGVIGRSALFDKDSKFTGEREELYVILDENLQVIFEHKPWSRGEYHPVVLAKQKELNITSQIRTDSSIEDMINNLMNSAILGWFPWCFGATNEEKASYDIEDSSDEWEEVYKVGDFYSNRLEINRCRENKRENKTLEYNMFTKIGKTNIDECIEWYGQNESMTPIQDVWFKLLEKDGIKIKSEPHTFGLDEELIMKEVDYRPKKVINMEREEEDNKFKKSLTQADKNLFENILKTLKEK